MSTIFFLYFPIIFHSIYCIEIFLCYIYLNGGDFVLKAKQLATIRKALKLSQKAFSEKISISQNHLSSIENEVRELTDRVAEDVIRVFNVNRNWLLNENEPMFIDSLTDMKLDDEVKELARNYAALPVEQRQIIRDMLNALSKK